MDWQGLAELVSPKGGFEPVHWLTLATVVAFLVLVGVLVMQSRRASVKRRDVAELVKQGAPGSLTEDPVAALHGIALSPIDRVFPRKPAAFLAFVAVLSAGCWLAGLALAPTPALFLKSVEWIVQPFYIAAHLVTLRLFINVFTRNYAVGISQLDMSRAEALRGIRPVLGWGGALAAVVIAAPLCWFDWIYLFNRYEPLAGTVGPADYLMWGIWCLEWFINAFIWVLLVSFMVKSCMTLSQYPFRARIDTVLQEKLYRPFLQMSAQGSTVVLGFSGATVVYIYLTEGALTDYLGLGITVVLLLVCFVPPWLMLRSKVGRDYRLRMIELRREADAIAGSGAPAGSAASAALASATSGRPIEQRLEEVVALLRMWHLQNLYGNLGQTEATAILVRLVAPAATIVWQVAQRHGEIGERLHRFFATLA